MRIRLATTEDLPDLVGLMSHVYQAFGEQPPPLAQVDAFFRAALAGEHLDVIVADDAGHLVGLLSLGYCPTTLRASRFAWLDDLFVLEERRGQGVARDLLAFAASHARGRGAAEIKLTSDPGDPRVSALHDAAGFRASAMQLRVLELGCHEGPSP